MKNYQYIVIVDALYDPVPHNYTCRSLHDVKNYLQNVIPSGYVLDCNGWRKEYGCANELHRLYGDFTNGKDYYEIVIKRKLKYL